MQIIFTSAAAALLLGDIARAGSIKQELLSKLQGTYTPTSEALTDMMAECGSNLGDGSAFDLQTGDGSGTCENSPGTCVNFYTLNKLLAGIDSFNSGKTVDEQFPSPVHGSRCLVFGAFLAQTYYESAHYLACKEYNPALGAYTPSSWGNTTLPDGNDYPQTCTYYNGSTPTNLADCWFGRGAIQVTWLANYMAYLPEFAENPDEICTKGQAAWQGSVAYWQAQKDTFTGTCASATAVPNPAGCDDACRQKRCDQQDKVLALLKPVTSPPTPPPPATGSYTVSAAEAADGCWGIGNTVCPNQGNSWQANICTPSQTAGCNLVANDTITYDCNGCS